MIYLIAMIFFVLLVVMFLGGILASASEADDAIANHVDMETLNWTPTKHLTRRGDSPDKNPNAPLASEEALEQVPGNAVPVVGSQNQNL